MQEDAHRPGDSQELSPSWRTKLCARPVMAFSHDPNKPLLHQDSSSSNDSSDACATTVVIGSVLSIDEDSMIWYQPFRSGMVDVPLHNEGE
ncbi:g protein-coupled receptor [Trichonephila clavata]|uniref:G protein-coupled receptor n=1 Tax=Trichonephila clavata TaxID=2740835 RepID=A0A8X6FRJ9_TRICU|nr:g protein-coupled receptor [Trichonephila clavata]